MTAAWMVSAFILGVGIYSLLVGSDRRVVPALVLLAGLMVWSAVLVSWARGLPREITLEVFTQWEREVAAVHVQQGAAIYVWVIEDGGPVSYVLPWSEKTARKAHEGAREAKNQGGKLMMRKSADGEFIFHPKPQAPLPEKQDG